jgi:hypothetical protein
MAAVLATVTEYIRSFGATNQVEEEEEEETNWMSGYDGTDRFSKASVDAKDFGNDDIISESTHAGSADSFSDGQTHRSRSALQTNISSDDFWHFYQRLSDLQSSQTNVCQEEINVVVQETQISDGCPQCEYWKLPLEPLPDKDSENFPHEKPKLNMKTSAALARRGCFRRNMRMFWTMFLEQDEFSILAEQIY